MNDIFGIQSDYCDFTEHQSTNPSDRKGTERENLLRFSETRKLWS